MPEARLGIGAGNRLRLECSAEDRRKAVGCLGVNPVKGGAFTYPMDEIVVLALMSYFGDDLQIDAKCKEWFNDSQERSKHLIELANLDDAEIPLSYAGIMKPYQRVGVQFATTAKRCIIGDDRGLGKSFEALASADIVGGRNNLIIAPGYLKYNWEREIKKWTQYKSALAEGARATRTNIIRNRKAEYLIVNYEMIRESPQVGGYPELHKEKWDCIIADEAHRFKSKDSQWTMGAKKLQSPYLFMLTGNPIANRPDEVWQLLNLIDPKKFTSYWAFVDYYCNVVDTFFGKEIVGVNKDRLAQLQFTLQPYLIRRMKADVAPWLPKKIKKNIELKLEGPQKTFYTTAEKKMRLELEDGGIEIIDTVVTLNTRLQQALMNPCILGGPDDSVVERATLELIKDIFEGDKKVIVGTWFVAAAEHFSEVLDKAKIRHWVITGKVTGKRRDDIVQAFKNCEEPCVLVGGISAMGEGLDIDECDHIIYMDRSWVPKDNEQFEDRIHRMTSTRPKNYYYMIVQDTIAQDKAEVLQEKTEMIEEVLSMRAVAEKLLKRTQSRA